MSFNCPSGASIQTSLAPTNIAFWYKNTSPANNGNIVSKHETGNSEGGYTLYRNGVTNTLAILARNAAGSVAFNVGGSAAVIDGAWHHIALLMDFTNGGTNQVYVDNALDMNTTAALAWGGTVQTLRFGRAFDTFWGNQPGEFAEAGLWSGTLTAAHVESLAKGFSPKLVSPSTLIGYLPLVGVLKDLKGTAITTAGTPAATAHIASRG